MGWLEGLLTGYVDRHREIEKENLLRAHDAMTREGEIYKRMLDSDDPQIRGMAATGMLEMGQPRQRKRGLAGWIGEMESSPIYPVLMKYFQNLPEGQRDDLLLPGQSTVPTTGGALPTPPAAAGSAALPATSPVVSGQPGLAQPTPSPAGTSAAAPTAFPSERTQRSLAATYAQPHAGVGTASNLFATPWVGAPPPTAPPFEPPALLASRAAAPEAAAALAPSAVAPTPAPAPGTPTPAEPTAAAPDLQVPTIASTTGLPEPAAAAAAMTRPPPPPARVFTKADVFPRAADLVGQREEADVTGSVRGWQRAFKLLNDPDWQEKGLQFAMAERLRTRGAMAGQSYAEGNIIPDASSPTGYSQELYLRADPTQRTRIPAQPPNTPEYMAEKARQATTARTEVMAGAPLSTQQRTQLTNKLHDDWLKLQGPIREMDRQFNLMETGLRRFREGERVASVEAIRVTLEKILDPNSVVREGEYARQGFGLSLMDRLGGLWQKYAAGGGEIPEPVLAEMVETARQFLAGMQGWNDNERQRITNQATAHQIDPAYIFGGNVTTPPPAPPPGGSAAPAVAPTATTTPATGTPQLKLVNGKWVFVQ
jgi:hypothetical protein